MRTKIDHLRLDVVGPVATLTLNRPERHNALSLDMYHQIPEMLSRLEIDRTVSSLVIRGCGLRAFSAGADITEFTTVRAGAEGARLYNLAVAEAERAISNFHAPTIAMVHGFCIGGGCGLALSCDLRLADTAAAFGITPARLGFAYSLESTKRLMDLAGPAEASYLLFSGRRVSAERALWNGLVNEVHPPEELEKVTYELAVEISKRAPMSLRATKEIIGLVRAGQVRDDDYTTALRNDLFESSDYIEGVEAFLGKRPPHFSGC
ncbi:MULTISPECIES: enoyl-CoA hydratase-related protein [unclassified Cryobacterium]|uniref:enoyl-CoA hydratase-related protein n=1 Tax=unclassified Cryobacterium TaxID=2649013 RepID=UPI0018E0A1A9|nr:MULTISPECIES: enoyl-CoA hydratase-related protein [unclassified Cryobacterium]